MRVRGVRRGPRISTRRLRRGRTSCGDSESRGAYRSRVLTCIRRWIARVVALVVTVVTLGRVSVEWDGVQGVPRAAEERGGITATVDPPDED